MLGDALLLLLEQARTSSSQEPPQVQTEPFPPSLGSRNPEFAKGCGHRGSSVWRQGKPPGSGDSRCVSEHCQVLPEAPTVLLDGQPHPGGPGAPLPPPKKR